MSPTGVAAEFVGMEYQRLGTIPATAARERRAALRERGKREVAARVAGQVSWLPLGSQEQLRFCLIGANCLYNYI